MNIKTNTNEGWICPKCGRVNSPYINSCPCCQNNNCYPETGINDASNNLPPDFSMPNFPSEWVDGSGGFKKSTPIEIFPYSFDYHIETCPECGQKIKVPNAMWIVGNWFIECPNCRHAIEMKDGDNQINF